LLLSSCESECCEWDWDPEEDWESCDLLFLDGGVSWESIDAFCLRVCFMPRKSSKDRGLDGRAPSAAARCISSRVSVVGSTAGAGGHSRCLKRPALVESSSQGTMSVFTKIFC
jgi:hypothetical protein